MDAITMLKDDHKTVEKLFKRFEAAGDKAYNQKREIVDRIIEALSVHAAVEEQIFYPVTRATVPKTEDMALESLEEHHIVKWVLSELDGMNPEDERFDAKVTVLIENVRHHVEEEEQDYFPLVRDELGRSALSDLGDAMQTIRSVAPTHPHPGAPDEPPANLVVGMASGVADRVGDTVSGLAQGSVAAAGDVIATVLRRQKPRSAPTGTKRARSTAAQVRSDAADVTETVIEKTKEARRRGEQTVSRARGTTKAAKSGAKSTARSAGKGAAKTAKAAKSAAKGTATSARKSASATKTTAKRGATTAARTARSASKSTASTAKRSARKTASASKSTSRSTRSRRAA